MSVLLVVALFLVIALVAALLYLRLPKGVATGKFTNMVVGHRGCRRVPNVPENSIPSFQYAIDHGAPAVELDCRLTKDGHIIVFHDDAMHRLLQDASGKPAIGNISDSTLAEIHRYQYSNHNNPADKPPLLEDVLLMCKKQNTKVFVELKSMYPWDAIPLAQAVVELFKKHNAHEFACVIAFNPLVVYQIRMLDPRIETCILFCNDFYSSSVKNQLEKTPLFVQYTAPLLNVLIKNVCIYLVPFVTGCTIMGPDTKITSQADLKSYAARGLEVYGWVANVQCELDLFLHYGASVGTDCCFPK